MGNDATCLYADFIKKKKKSIKYELNINFHEIKKKKTIHKESINKSIYARC